MTFSWAEKTTPPAPAQPQGLGAEYQAWRRQTSASGIYAEPAAPATKPDLYVERRYGGLEGYAGAKADPLAPRQDESPEAYRRRILSVARALPDEEVQARLAAAGDERIATHSDLRQHLDGRTTGTGIGIFDLAPEQRAAALGGRFEGRRMRGTGATAESISDAPMSSVEAYALARQRDAAQRGQVPQRTEAPTGSSGEGIFIR
jgi:hypothetical protein